VPTVLAAQGVHAEVGRLFEADGWTTYRLGMQRGLAGPVAVAVYGTHLREEAALGRRHWGGGADLVLLRGRRSGPYLVGGLAGGFSSDSADDWWRSWSAGGGYQVVLGGAFALAAEGRYRSIAPGERAGFEISARIGALFGGTRARTDSPQPHADLPAAPSDQPDRGAPETPLDAAPPPRRPPPLTAGPAESSASAALADSVVATALAALGTSYRLGGTTHSGFDCSGLIQHAYGRHGVALPRVSRDQARQGVAVERTLDALRPGDILTFAEQRRGRVTHVGLYLGDGQFVHSARGGVQISMLSASDPYGRWYWNRWVGARRIVRNDS
jgi:cell wall-associated NlpC family hydrolase